jgi:hypothetical protein
MPVFIFYHRRSWVTLRTSNDPLPQLVEIGGSDGLRKRKFPREDWRDANFTRLDIHIR